MRSRRGRAPHGSSLSTPRCAPRWIHDGYNARGVCPVTLRKTPGVKRGDHEPRVCEDGEWKFAGTDYKRQATKWRCPTGECKPKSMWVKADRLHPLIPRHAKRSSALYKSRGAVEREFGRLKHEWTSCPCASARAGEDGLAARTVSLQPVADLPGNILYYGDNLDVLRQHVPDESIDLVYLDPPFKSDADYNVLFAEHTGERSTAQIKVFTDTWKWDRIAAESFREIVEKGGDVSRVMQAFRMILGDNDMLAYLSMMAPRMIELHRVIKPTGSLYLHCDPTASHYLKLLLDAVFGPENFRNEIIWHYKKWPTGKYAFQRNHDVLLFYSRSRDKARTFNQLYMPRAASTLKRFGTAKITSGHDAAGRRVPSTTTGEESEGVRQDDVWAIGRVPPIKQLFPTEKPSALLERVLQASSNEGDVVLDPFCGCGTTIVAAEQLKRRWIGIDITALATSLIKSRLQDTYGDRARFRTVGEPITVTDARELAVTDPYQFQWWALGLVGARPLDQKKGADKGIDGRLYFHDQGSGGDTKQIIFSVKAGKVQVSHVRDLRGVLDREKAAIGVFISLRAATQPMRTEAASAGVYESPWRSHPRLQLLTVEELLSGKRVDMPPQQASVTFKKAAKAVPSSPEPDSMF